MSANTRHLGVIGFGQMGRGIAHTALLAGFEVTACGRSEDGNAAAFGAVERSLGRLVERASIDAATRDAALGRLSTTLHHEDLKVCDAVIETITEDEDAKRDVFRSLDAIAAPEALLITNTSSLSVTRLAEAAEQHPERVVGMHFFHPVPAMDLVEVTRARQTSDEAHAAACELGGALGKQVVTSCDSPSFIVNRALLPFLNEAMFMLEEGVSTAAEIDEAMRVGLKHPMGPLELADLIGLDTLLLVMDGLHRRMGDDKYRVCDLLRHHVEDGHLGRKTGRGFHRY